MFKYAVILTVLIMSVKPALDLAQEKLRSIEDMTKQLTAHAEKMSIGSHVRIDIPNNYQKQQSSEDIYNDFRKSLGL